MRRDSYLNLDKGLSNPDIFLFIKLPRLDSNQRPIGYTYPRVSAGGGLSHHPGWDVGRLWDLLDRLLIPSLCTFLATCGNHRLSPDLAQDYRHLKMLRLP